MVEEVIGTILQAEDKAEQIVKDAKEQAKAILAKSKQDSEGRRMVAASDCKKLMERVKKVASEQGQSEYEEVMQEGKKVAAQQAAEYEKKVDAAVEFVVSSLIA